MPFFVSCGQSTATAEMRRLPRNLLAANAASPAATTHSMELTSGITITPKNWSPAKSLRSKNVAPEIKFEKLSDPSWHRIGQPAKKLIRNKIVI